MKTVARRPESLTSAKFHYCPGCTHGIIHRLVAECVDEMNMRENTIGICPVGCSVLAYDYFNFDMLEAGHGRAPAIATGIKRIMPDRCLITYQGDGDLAAIGTAEIIHAAARGEKITVIFVNNAIYGMTNGQMAPTSLIGQVTDTTPRGRDPEVNGYPIRVSEMLATLDGVVYIERVSTHDVKNVHKAKKAIKKAFEVQVNKKGFSMVEVLSSCPSNWGLNPVESLKWIEENMIPQYPLGVFKDN